MSRQVVCPKVKECEDKIGGTCDHSESHSSDIFRCDKNTCSIGQGLGFGCFVCVPVEVDKATT